MLIGRSKKSQKMSETDWFNCEIKRVAKTEKKEKREEAQVGSSVS